MKTAFLNPRRTETETDWGNKNKKKHKNIGVNRNKTHIQEAETYWENKKCQET